MQHSDNKNGVAVIIYMKTVDPKEIIISVSPNLKLIYPMTMVYLRMYLLQNTVEDVAMGDPRLDIFPYISPFVTPPCSFISSTNIHSSLLLLCGFRFMF